MLQTQKQQILQKDERTQLQYFSTESCINSQVKYISPTISLHQKFDKGQCKAKVHNSYRPRNVREELNKIVMQLFLVNSNSD